MTHSYDLGAWTRRSSVELGLADKKMAADPFCLVFKPMKDNITLPENTRSNVLIGSGEDTKAQKAAKSQEEEVKRVEQLAEEFAARVLELEFSPAKLLSFLLEHKQSPKDAIDNVEIWNGVREKEASDEV